MLSHGHHEHFLPETGSKWQPLLDLSIKVLGYRCHTTPTAFSAKDPKSKKTKHLGVFITILCFPMFPYFIPWKSVIETGRPSQIKSSDRKVRKENCLLQTHLVCKSPFCVFTWLLWFLERAVTISKSLKYGWNWLSLSSWQLAIRNYLTTFDKCYYSSILYMCMHD